MINYFRTKDIKVLFHEKGQQS